MFVFRHLLSVKKTPKCFKENSGLGYGTGEIVKATKLWESALSHIDDEVIDSDVNSQYIKGGRPIVFSPDRTSYISASGILNRLISNKISAKEDFSIDIDMNIDSSITVANKSPEDKLRDGNIFPHIMRLTVNGQFPFFSSSGVFIDRLEFKENGIGGIIFLRNCYIRTLIFRTTGHRGIFGKVTGGVDGFCQQIEIDNCVIHNLLIEENCCENLIIKESLIASIECSSMNKDAPFETCINISNDSHIYLGSTIVNTRVVQNYRNLTYHSRDKSDPQTFGIIKGSQALIESNLENRFMKFFHKLFFAISFYGNRPERTALVLSIFIVFGTILVAWYDGATMPIDSSNLPVWLAEFSGDTARDKVLRSSYLVFKCTFNPLFLLQSKTTIQPKNIYIALYLAVNGVINITLVTTMILGIRKRLRVS